MERIIIKVEDKFINEAFQNWCFSVGIKWNNGETKFLDYGKPLLGVYENKILVFGPSSQDYFNIPQEWNEATEAILEMIKPKEKKWTDEDMIRFAKHCDMLGYSEVGYKKAISEFK